MIGKEFEIQEVVIQGRTLIEPKSIYSKDMALFKHCSAGSIAVIKEVFNREVKPLLFAHGVTCITVVEKEKF